MLKLDKAKAADFSPHLKSRFRLAADKHSLDLELVEAKASGPKSAKGRSPFALLFKAAAGKHLPQQMYRIDHAKLGAMDLFIVPVRADKSGCYYEAIFN